MITSLERCSKKGNVHDLSLLSSGAANQHLAVHERLDGDPSFEHLKHPAHAFHEVQARLVTYVAPGETPDTGQYRLNVVTLFFLHPPCRARRR